ncbi:uncharacterized protein LOC132181938 [Corylus avellana]|uniref:uncharacterized protein LOC132181938 n=1 Tax=Corylus avellana TaxID=13451 RepID=UPI00286ABAAE|nr:uncharacterized protein LOC132181938 [Corylus avellana]
MEAFNRMINASINRGFINGFYVGARESDQVIVSNLLFADDALIFCGAAPDQIRFIKALLIGFETVSRLKVNRAKFVFIPIGGTGEAGELTGILGCGTSSLPLKYLGLTLGASFKLLAIWKDMLEKIARRLAPWKHSYLSKGARLTLIKSTLSNLPTYFLSLFPIPASVANRIEKIQRNFLWGGLNDEPKFHLVSWHEVCSPIFEGGLGIRSLRLFNQARLGKWL